jgi:hypothetical protein
MPRASPSSSLNLKNDRFQEPHCQLLGAKRTSVIQALRSANDPKPTWRVRQNSQVKRPLTPLSVTLSLY